MDTFIDNATEAIYQDHDQQPNTDSARSTQLAMNRFILPILCVFGIIGIILTVIVLSKKNMCTSTNCYLMALAIADLLFLIILATTLVENQFAPDSKAIYMYQIYITYVVIFLDIFLMASVWMTVMLAVERYIAICHPFVATRMCTITKARIIIPIIFFLMLLFRMSHFWEHKVVSFYDPSINTTLYYVQATDLSVNKVYLTISHVVVNAILTSALPFLLLTILNILLIREVRKSTEYFKRNMMVSQNSTSVVQREELQITIMLISVIIVFFICQAPYVTYTAVASIANFGATNQTLLFRSVAIILLTIKSSVNFILYCWFSEKFWATLKRSFCLEKCWFKKDDYNSQNANYYHMRRISSCATRESTF